MFLDPNSIFRFRKSTLALCAFLSIAFASKAAELDIVVNEQARRAHVTPLCARLVKLSNVVTRDDKYHKALCLKFGIGIAEQAANAVDLLRDAAVQGHGEAQLALADALAQGSGAEQREALHWYERGANAGDSRAASRAARLSPRLKAQADAVERAPEPEFPGSEDSTNLPKGYHCHFYGVGQRVCHGSMFD